jgi:hypothetical protein
LWLLRKVVAIRKFPVRPGVGKVRVTGCDPHRGTWKQPYTWFHACALKLAFELQSQIPLYKFHPTTRKNTVTLEGNSLIFPWHLQLSDTTKS